MLDAVDENSWPPMDIPSSREVFRLSREERNYVAGHALDSINELSGELMEATNPHSMGAACGVQVGSAAARKIAALSNLLGDIDWEREGAGPPEGTVAGMHPPTWFLGELFPVAQLRPWLEEWVGDDTEALGAVVSDQDVESAQVKLGTGILLLARLEKWMAPHGH